MSSVITSESPQNQSPEKHWPVKTGGTQNHPDDKTQYTNNLIWALGTFELMDFFYLRGPRVGIKLEKTVFWERVPFRFDYLHGC